MIVALAPRLRIHFHSHVGGHNFAHVTRTEGHIWIRVMSYGCVIDWSAA